MTDVLTQLAFLGLTATTALALCVVAVRHLDPATALSAPRRTRTRLRWHLRHATPATILAALLTLTLLLTTLLLD